MFVRFFRPLTLALLRKNAGAEGTRRGREREMLERLFVSWRLRRRSISECECDQCAASAAKGLE